METNDPAPSPATAAPGTSTEPGGFVVAGLALSSLTIGAPLLYHGWHRIQHGSASLAGRVLLREHALSRDAFSAGAKVAALLVFAGLVGILLANVFTKAEDRTNAPWTFGLVILPLGSAALVGCATWLWQVLRDRPDSDFGFAMAAAMVWLAGTLGSPVLLGRTVRAGLGRLWGWCKTSPRVSGFVAGSSLAAGLLVGSYEANPVREEIAKYEHNAAPPRPAAALKHRAAELELTVVADALVDLALEDMTLAATGSAAKQVPRLGLPLRGGPFERCVEALSPGCAVKPCAVDQVHQILRRKDVQDADAADISQTVLLEVCLQATDADTLDAWRAAYFFRANGRRLDGYRKGRRECKYLEQAGMEQEMLRGAGQAEFAPEDSRQLDVALCRLSSRDRCVIEGRYFEELTDREIAVKCALSSDAMVRQQLVRARQKLREELAKN